LVKEKPTDVVVLAGVNDVIADHGAVRIEADFLAGWQALHDLGARVWVVLMTPWAGHVKSTAKRQDVTRAVNAWVVAQQGQTGGPDHVIDPSTLGVDGKLRPEFSGDGLHMNVVGYKALAALVERALRGVLPATVGADGRRVLFLGDSLTASDYWKRVTVVDGVPTGKGWPGHRIAQILAKAQPLIDARPTDVVLLASVNDIAGGRSVDTIIADLVVAWAALRAVGARVYAVLPTPWYGYTGGKAGESRPMFFADPVAAPKLRATTAAVRDFMQQAVGTPGGPDVVIDTAALGDDRGRLLPKYSHDGLHMNGRGYAALAALVEQVLRGATPIAVGAVEPPRWPEGWPGAVPAIHDAVDEANRTFGVPVDILYGIMRKESAFDRKLVGYKNATSDETSKKYSKTFRASYERNRNLTIKGSSMTWGQMFTAEQWTAWGICQLLPFNIVGKRYGVKAGAPLSALFDVRAQIMCAGELLKTLYDKYGDWETAVLRYNGARSYLREVLAFAAAFRAAQAV
jgi:lysophospholipase L1-like esterase